MADKYVWLHGNLDKYSYNTEEAKALYEKFSAIDVSESIMNEAAKSELAECYNTFLEMFNNNPFDYENGIRKSEIDTDIFECYFMSVGGEKVPVGYYRPEHPVESVIFLDKETDENKKEIIQLRRELEETLENEAEKISKGYAEIKKEKKANFFRAGIAGLSCVFLLCYSIWFLIVCDIVEIVKNIGDKARFVNAVESGMAEMPLLSDAGVIGWCVFWVFHIIVLIICIKNIKSVVKEGFLAYQKTVTSGFCAKSDKCIKEMKAVFEGNVEKCEISFGESARQGKTLKLEKKPIAKKIKKVSSDMDVAKKYLETDKGELRGIYKNRTIAFLLVCAIISSVIYSVMPRENVKAKMEVLKYKAGVMSDTIFLKSEKMVLTTSGECTVYKKSNVDSEIVCVLSEFTRVVLEKRIYEGEESWSKVKLITDSHIYSGWIPTERTIPYNVMNYEEFEQIEISYTDSSSYLVGDKAIYFSDFAVDGRKDTSWQDGNENDTGSGEFISLHFSEKEEIVAIQIFPGNAKSEKLFKNNERIKKANLKFSGGKSVSYEFDDLYTEEFQTIWLNKPVKTDYIKINIKDTYAGKKYKDLCVSEIVVYKNKSGESDAEG